MSGNQPAKVEPTVLVVEDERGILEGLQFLLELEGIRVIGAGNGLDALEQLARHRFDLVLTDLMMPVMDGGEFVRRLRADPRFRELPVILSSAGNSLDPQLLELVDAFLGKPYSIPRLLQLIDRMLGRG